MNKRFIKLRDKFSQKLYKYYLKTEYAGWNFYINSTSKNLEKMTEANDKYSALFQNEKLYHRFKEIDSTKLGKHEQKQLKDLLQSFEDELENGEELKRLRDKESEISQKYNSYVLKIDEKEVSRADVRQILQKEPNPEIRQKAYVADVNGGDIIAKDLVEFVKLRNEYAKKKGYDNYFEYKLKDAYEVDIKDLEILLNDVYKKAKNKIKEFTLKKQNELREFFNVDELKPYHYGYLTEDNPVKKVNDYITSKEQVVEICKSAYKAMGYDIEKFIDEGKVTLDLFPRKNKNTHGFCFTIDAGKDARILANLTNNTNSIETLNHELGHCVYTLGTSKELPFLDRQQYPAMTEAIAMMMGDLQKRENILSNVVPDDILNEFKQTFKEDEAKFVSWSMTIINFEKEMYRNPNRDLRKLWRELQTKYEFRSENEELNNRWATIPHFLSHPAYYQNYFRATLMKAQFYNYLNSITTNQKTAEILENELFKYGISMEENELIEKFTGKKLSVDDFVKILV